MNNIITITTGKAEENTYIVFREDSSDAILIDPGDDSDQIDEVLEENKLNPKYILLTHGHFDHTNAVKHYREKGAKVYIGKSDLKMLKSDANLSHLAGVKYNYTDADVLLEKDLEFDLEHFHIKSISAPGHTKGGMIYIIGKDAFVGDIIFKDSVGRTDFPGGNEQELVKSINKILKLGNDINIYPGHGEMTTIIDVKNNNETLKKLINN